MFATEFQAEVVDGRIELPEDLRNRLQGYVNVILFAADQDESGWPAKNRRRWELIARKNRHALTPAEERELAHLEQRADKMLARVGPRPIKDLERWYSELSQEGSMKAFTRRIREDLGWCL